MQRKHEQRVQNRLGRFGNARWHAAYLAVDRIHEHIKLIHTVERGGNGMRKGCDEAHSDVAPLSPRQGLHVLDNILLAFASHLDLDGHALPLIVKLH